MTVSPLKKALLPSLLISGAVFSSLTLPLAVFGAQPLVIQVQEEPIFVGKLKDIAAPYVGLATLLSAGTGIASLTMGAWQQSSRKANKLEERLSNLQQQLQETEGQLETLKLSEARLHATGLGAFLDEVEVAGQAVSPSQEVVQTATTQAVTPIHLMQVTQVEAQLAGLRQQLQEKEAQLAALENLQPARTIAHQAAIVSPIIEMNAVEPASPLVANSVVSSPALVQPNQKKAIVPAAQIAPTNAALHALAQVSELQNRLEQIVSQVGTLQNALQTELQPVVTESQAVDDSYAALHHLNQRIQKLESLWSTQAMAS